jgi:hypothetical protein
VIESYEGKEPLTSVSSRDETSVEDTKQYLLSMLQQLEPEVTQLPTFLVKCLEAMSSVDENSKLANQWMVIES